MFITCKSVFEKDNRAIETKINIDTEFQKTSAKLNLGVE